LSSQVREDRPDLSIDFRYAPAESWTAICHEDDEHKTLVSGEGALMYGYRRGIWNMYRFDRTVEFSIAGDGPCIAVGQDTETASNALVETVRSYCSSVLRLVTFRHWREGRAFDVVRWEIENTASEKDTLKALQIEIFDHDAFFTSGPEGASPRIYAVPDREQAAVEWWYDRNEPEALSWVAPAGAVLIRSHPQPLAAAQPSGFRPIPAFSTVPVEIAPGGRLSGVLVVPLDGLDVPELDDTWLAVALASERKHWSSLWPEGLPIQVPDEGVQAMLDASARNMLQARARRNDRYVFEVGPTLYRDFWVADGYFMLEAVRYLGLADQADEALAVLETHVQDDGSIVALQDVGHTKETAIAIAMLVRQAELAGEIARLDDWWERISRAVEHIAALHVSTLDLPESSSCRGLMPAAFPDGGAAGRRCEYTTVLWCLAGLRAVAQTAQRLGRPEAQRYSAAYAQLRSAFDAHAEQNLEPLAEGHRYLPMLLEGNAHHTRPEVKATAPEEAVRPETATWAFAHAIYPGEIFSPDDSLVQDFIYLLDSRDDEEQIPATTGWLPYRAVWSYYASFAAHVFLWAGQPAKAIEYLYGFANHAAPTRVWREEQGLHGSGQTLINGDMPHNWASAEFVRLVRNLLAFERGEELQLLPAVPEHWLHHGKDIRLDTPTRFGRVRLTVKATQPGGVIDVHLDRGAVPAGRVVVNVPSGRWQVSVNGTVTDASGPSILEVST
jgi:hypothetical protein